MNTTKRILSVLLVACMLVSALALTACSGSGDKEDTTTASKENDGTQASASENAYTVTILDDENNPISGVTLMISDYVNVFETLVTDQNGKCSLNTADNANLSVIITEVPDGYQKPKTEAAAFGSKKALTLTVSKETDNKVTYTVTIVDQDGNAVQGVELQLCPNGTCLSDQFITDADGKITKDMAPDQPVDVKVVNVPDGYSKPEALANGYHAKIEAGQTEITVTITKN